MMWLMWLLLAVVLGAAEMLTLTLGFGLLAAGALVAAVVAGLGGPLALQVAAGVVTGGVGLLAVRPIAKRHMALPPMVREGSDALVGRPGVVIREVTATRGLVHVGGEDWSARSYDEDQVIPVGARVDVLEISGATALVYPRDPVVGGDPITKE